jgi:subtilisin family serine protease
VFGVTNDVVDNCDGATRDVAALSSVVAVGVSDHRDRIGFSGFGSCLDLVAPSRPRAFAAGGVPTTDRLGLAGYVDGDYQAGFGGTSAAAPLVAGIAGLLLSLNPELEAADVRRLLVFTAEKIDASVARYDASGFSPTAGFGRINAARAVVPTVTLTVSPERAAVGEPVTVTLAASAPFGLAAVEWWGSAAPLPSAHTPAERALSGDVTATVTWSVVFDRPGRYELWADARDERSATPRPGYPHRAREAAGVAAASVVATERRRGESR